MGNIWRAYKNSSTLLRVVPFPTPYDTLSLDWRFATPTQNSLLSHERVKLWTSEAGTFTWAIQAKAHLKFGRKGSVAYPGSAKFLDTPYYRNNG